MEDKRKERKKGKERLDGRKGRRRGGRRKIFVAFCVFTMLEFL